MTWLSRKWLAYAIGLLFIWLSFYVYIKFTDQYKTTVTTMNTLKPQRMLQVGEVVQADMVRNVTIPIVAHNAQSYTNLADIVGKTVRVPIGEDDEFADWKLAKVTLVPENGQRYYSFRADALQNVSNMVRRGDRVDVWTEFDTPKWLVDGNGNKTLIGSIKLLENVLVAYVKGAEGQEIIEANDTQNLLNPIRLGNQQVQSANLEAARSKPNARPDMNTYIMSESEYNAYVIGSSGGKIKLALPNLLAENNAKSKTTEMFEQLSHTDIFNKEVKKQEIQVKAIIPSEVGTK